MLDLASLNLGVLLHSSSHFFYIRHVYRKLYHLEINLRDNPNLFLLHG